MTELKVIERISKCLKELDTVDEFNLYYNKHIDEMNALTTHKLNKLYRINGYQITKINKVYLCTKKMKEIGDNKDDSTRIIVKDEAAIEEIKKEIKETINGIIKFLNHSEIDVSPPSDT